MSHKIKKEMINNYLRELGKQYQKMHGKNLPLDVYIVGGGSILINYGFRTISMDVDALYRRVGAFNDAIHKVAEKYELEVDWLNDDFITTSSFSEQIKKYAKHYRTFGNCVHFYTLDGEYLLATKLRSGRKYKHDMSDVVGILLEEREKENILTEGKIENAFQELYGNDSTIKETKFYPLLQKAISLDDEELEKLYEVIKKEEEMNAEKAIHLIQEGIKLTENNIDSFLEKAEKEIER